MATIRKRGSRWEAQIRKRGVPSETRSFSHKVDAQAWAKAVEAVVERGEYQNRSLARATLFREVIDRYRAEVSPTKKGHAVEALRLAVLRKSALGQMTLDQIDAQAIALWRDQRLLVVSGSTVNRDLNLISHLLNTARREWGYAVRNSVPDVRRPKNNRPRRRRLSRGEERVLFEALSLGERNEKGQLQGGARNPWMKPLVELALETAMRRSELLSLHWDDVCLEERFVRLSDTKNGELRDVPLSTRAAICLAALDRHADGRVFPISEDSVKRAFSRAVTRAGIKDLHFHDLRHEATSRLAGKLSNVLELSAVTGHKTLSMLQRYYHPRASDLALKLD